MYTHFFLNLNLTVIIKYKQFSSLLYSLYQTSFIRIANFYLIHSFLYTSDPPHLSSYNSHSPFSLIFVSVTASRSFVSFLNLFIAFLLQFSSWHLYNTIFTIQWHTISLIDTRLLMAIMMTGSKACISILKDKVVISGFLI